MEALQILKFSFKHGERLNFTSGTTKEEEISIMEAVFADQMRVPEDINSFIDSLLLHVDDEDDDYEDVED
ncbi:hypothetical protein BJ138DRAFT_1019731 [Hygrophoropsis aurantiaca]|uniref:Uncharacterized protein n=1 Tax=Hygrophoropsis aurantiaca TaxID=72124 RepID=A0ACB7ZSG8_9AGAM|nr:hypothetical protein BJ138DRAFT_1019731 [Hygrophoropsis aurantiaca]